MTDQSSEARHGKRGNRSGGWWPVALIVVGVLILAGNLGLGLGPLWRFLGNALQLWPVALVAIGLDMLTRGRYRLLVASVAVGLVVVVAAYGGFGRTAGPPVTVEQAVAGARSARVTLGVGASAVTLGAAPNATAAIWGTVRPTRNEHVEQKAAKRGDVLDFSLRSRTTGWPFFNVFGGGSGGSWNLTLNEDLPTDLVIDGGVGSLTLDLERADLTGLDLDAGVGMITITLPRAGGFTGTVDGGVGGTTILVPADLAVVIEVDTGVGAVNVEAGFEKSGNTYRSPAARTAGADVARLRVDVGVGSLTIRSRR